MLIFPTLNGAYCSCWITKAEGNRQHIPKTLTAIWNTLGMLPSPSIKKGSPNLNPTVLRQNINQHIHFFPLCCFWRGMVLFGSAVTARHGLFLLQSPPWRVLSGICLPCGILKRGRQRDVRQKKDGRACTAAGASRIPKAKNL